MGVYGCKLRILFSDESYTDTRLRLTASVPGNPVSDARGRLVEQRAVELAAAAERQTFNLRQQSAGTLLLRTTTNGQIQTVQVVKQ